jgi:hypothetical protein
MRCDAVVTGVGALAMHKVAGSTPVTRFRNFKHLRASAVRKMAGVSASVSAFDSKAG